MENAQHGVEFEGPVDGSDGRVSRSTSSTDAGRLQRREPPVGAGNTMRKQMLREIGGLHVRPPPRPDAAFCAEKFRHFKLLEEFFILADREVPSWMKRSITQIIPANDFIFVIDCNGYCAAFHHTANGSTTLYKKNGHIWYFNLHAVLMEALFYNKINDCIICVTSKITRHGYKMTAVPLESIRRRDAWGNGFPVFGSRTNNLPLFDCCNNLAVLSLYENGRTMNNVYEMQNYELVHSIAGKIHSIKTRPGIMILAYKVIRKNLRIEILSTENWTVLKNISYATPPHNRLQYVGLCHENLLLQENDQDMQVIDIWNNGNTIAIIEKSKNQRLLLSSDLNANNVLLNFENGMVLTCNSHGEQVVHENAGNDSRCSSFHMKITRDKNLAIMYSRKPIENPREGVCNSQASSTWFNICNTFNGKSIVKVNPSDNLGLPVAKDSDNNRRTNDAQSSTHEALKNVTALFYDEEHHRIYTGNTNGFVHVWSN